MMEHIRLCTVWPMDNWFGSSMSHIQGWVGRLSEYATVMLYKKDVCLRRWNMSWSLLEVTTTKAKADAHRKDIRKPKYLTIFIQRNSGGLAGSSTSSATIAMVPKWLHSQVVPV